MTTMTTTTTTTTTLMKMMGTILMMIMTTMSRKNVSIGSNQPMPSVVTSSMLEARVTPPLVATILSSYVVPASRLAMSVQVEMTSSVVRSHSAAPAARAHGSHSDACGTVSPLHTLRFMALFPLQTLTLMALFPPFTL